MSKLESQGGIQEGIKKRRKSLDDRAQHMELVAQEKGKIADISRQLLLSTTSEGAEAVQRAIRDAAAETNREFKRQNKVIERLFGDCKKAEKDLLERTKAARQDAAKAGDAARRVKEAKDAAKQLVAAEKAATKDGEFTDQHKELQKQERLKSEQRRDAQRRQLEQATLAW